MIQVASKQNVQQILSFGNIILINDKPYENLTTYTKNNFVDVYKGKFYFGSNFNGLFYFLKENGESIYLLDNKSNINSTLEGNWYIANCETQSLKNFLRLRKKNEENVSNYLLDIEGNLIQTKHLYDLEFTNSFVFKGFSHTIIESYSKNIEQLIWSLDTSQYGTYKVRTDIGFDAFPNKIDRPLFADETTIYAPMKGGQLLALNATDGSVKWILEMGISCGYANLGDRIYANNGDELFEIDANLGVVLKTVAYKSIKELKGYFGFTGDHKVYDDYVILKDQHNGWVVMFDRQTLTLSHMAETGARIGSDAGSVHWLDNKLYVYTFNTATVHIFEPS
jgi:outer membrane protein assembly factor BamB